jgi:hypothetical protein
MDSLPPNKNGPSFDTRRLTVYVCAESVFGVMVSDAKGQSGICLVRPPDCHQLAMCALCTDSTIPCYEMGRRFEPIMQLRS